MRWCIAVMLFGLLTMSAQAQSAVEHDDAAAKAAEKADRGQEKSGLSPIGILCLVLTVVAIATAAVILIFLWRPGATPDVDHRYFID